MVKYFLSVDKDHKWNGQIIDDSEGTIGQSRQITRFATVSDVANIISDAQIKFRRDPSAKIDTSDLVKLYEETVFDLAKYIVERVNVKD